MSKSNNSDFSYSPDANSIKHEFYERKFMLYVEGEDDITFWDCQFRRYIPECEYKIEQVYGKENLEPYIKEIIEGQLENSVVACDLDYSDFQEARMPNICIVRTYGHSIENTMFCPKSLDKYIRKITHTTESHKKEIDKWIDSFCNSTKPLLPYEIKNAVNPEHCTRLPVVLNKGYHFFRISKSSSLIDDKKIHDHIKSIQTKYDHEDIAKIEQQISENTKGVRYILQGHFLADGMMTYIRERVNAIAGKSISLSNNALYGAFSECDYSCSPWCADMIHIKSQIIAVAKKYSCSPI